ncbi:MAG: TraR/DksA family transcriptional regulator [Saprospiraceae bacterium]
MTTEERDALREHIALKILKTENDIAEYEALSAPVAPDVAIGRISRMDAINNKSVVEAALREARQKLSKLQMALSRIDSSEFGLCSRCKQPIPYKRLWVMPDSDRCVRCSS